MTRARRPATVERLDDLAALGTLGKQLEVQAAARARDERARVEQARRLAREADLFRLEVADVVPLAPTGRADPRKRPAHSST